MTAGTGLNVNKSKLFQHLIIHNITPFLIYSITQI